MARRRARSSFSWINAIIVLVVLGILLTHPAAAIAVGVVVAVVVAVLYRNRVQQAKAEGARQAELAAEQERELQEAKRWWRETPFGEGGFSVTLRVDADSYSDSIVGFLCNLHSFQGRDEEDVAALVERAEHVAPQVVAEGVDQASAVRLKKALEDLYGKVKIVEATTLPLAGPRREAIPERVRHEVWRRDGGVCVDCGSREKLEFDHIVPWSKGGANTARNLELRCEICNRKKAAKI